MALSSSSTDSDVLAAYDDNARYWDSQTKAENLLEAIIILQVRLPQSNSIAGRSFSRESLENLRKEVLAQLKAVSTDRNNFVRGKPI